MGLYPNQLDEVRKSYNALRSVEEEIKKLLDYRSKYFEIENMINERFSKKVDIEGYTLLSKILRVIEWSSTGKYAK